MNEPATATTKRMKLRYAGVCRGCGIEVLAGVVAVYDKVAKNVTYTGCTEQAPMTPVSVSATIPLVPEPVPVDEPEVPVDEPEVIVGAAGASARREFERRKVNDDRHIAEWKGRVRAKHRVLGGLILAVADDPKNSGTRAWDVGAHGEEVFAASLDRLTDTGLYFLHDRRIPPTRANIDHIVIAPTGVYVIDAKNYTGRAHLRVEAGIFSPGSRSSWSAGGTAPSSSTASTSRSTGSGTCSPETASAKTFPCAGCSASSKATGPWLAVPSPSVAWTSSGRRKRERSSQRQAR